jgi:predicted O-methyltransferase YrrM
MLSVARHEIEPARIRSFPNTYLNEIETGLLVTLVNSVQPEVMIEIGCQEGRTAKIVLDNVPSLRKYIGIDIPSDRAPTLACQRGEVPRSAGVYASGDPRFFVLVCESGSLGLEPADLEACDAVFIDGDHSENAVARDSVLARSLVRPGGIIIAHDYGNDAVEVSQALDRLDDQGWPWRHIEGTWLAYCRIK